MIQQPALVALVLIALTGILWKLKAHPFWYYMIPILFTTFGWLPEASPAYTFFSQQMLPAAILLLLFGTDLKALRSMGLLAALIMLAGSLGTILGGLVSFLIFSRWLPEGTWASVGALTGSWIGGSMNMLAVKEALQIPDAVIAPVIIVDVLIAYAWMAFLISASNFQTFWNKIIGRANPHDADAVNLDAKETAPLTQKKRIASTAFVVLASVCFSLLAQWTSKQLPQTGQIISPAAWTVLLITTLALFLSLTPVSRMSNADTSRTGTFILYLLLSSIGARANFHAAFQSPVFLAFGLVWIVIHGSFLMLAGYLLKAPLKLIATASQANIGGPISAPIVGATYHPQMAGIGLLMAILGNVLGTYLGLLTAVLAHHL